MPGRPIIGIARKPWPEEREREPQPVALRPVGRPSLYLQDFCQDIIDFCAKGYSIGAWAGRKGIARSTINTWAAQHPEFSEAVEVAKGLKLANWEDRLLQARDDAKTTGPQATLIAFGLKNMGTVDWRGEPEPPQRAPEQHQHIHLHMKPAEAADAYQRLLREG
jgi:hypothetical protein